MAEPPRNAAEVATVTGWVMLIAILLAPATRVGYLLYPINLFVWAWMLRGPTIRPTSGRHRGDGPADGVVRRDPARVVSCRRGVSNSSTEYGVDPVEVVGETTTPTSQ